MTAMADRLAIITRERVKEELAKLVLGAEPRRGLELLVDTGLAAHVLPELPGLQLVIDEHRHKDVYEHTLQVLERAVRLEEAGPDLVLRLAALLHDVGKPRTRRFEDGGGVSFHHHEVVGAKMAKKRLQALTYGKDVVEAVTLLTELHLRFHGYGKGEWSDSAVRRYVTDAGPQLERLHKLVRSDCTTRNQRRARALSEAYDDLEERIARLREQEELDRIRPDLDGEAIMAVLGVPPGPVVGRPTSTCWGCAWSTGRSARSARRTSSGRGRPSRAWRRSAADDRLRRLVGGPARAGEPVDQRGQRVAGGDEEGHDVALAVVGQQQRGGAGGADEAGVERGVVEGEDAAAVLVVDALLQQRVDADLAGLRGEPDDEGRDEEQAVPVGQAEGQLDAAATAKTSTTQRWVPRRRVARGRTSGRPAARRRRRPRRPRRARRTRGRSPRSRCRAAGSPRRTGRRRSGAR